MSGDQRFTLVIIGLGLIFTVLTGIASVIWKASGKIGETLSQVKDMQQDISKTSKALDEHMSWHLGRLRR